MKHLPLTTNLRWLRRVGKKGAAYNDRERLEMFRRGVCQLCLPHQSVYTIFLVKHIFNFCRTLVLSYIYALVCARMTVSLR